VLKPGREAEAEAIFKKWELDFAVIGEVTEAGPNGGHMELVWNGETVADVPLDPLADEAPLYERPYAVPKATEPLTDIPESTDIAADLLKLMGSPALASRRWIYQQYDQSVGGDTVQRPGGDAAVVRVHGTKKALAITTDCTPRYCYADPYEGGKQAVAEAYRNLCAVGAKPLAITNCLNFGNPQRPEVMGQFVGCIHGIAEACRVLDFPVVSGNVSLYNETKNEDGTSTAILPTPAIGGVGLLDDWEKSATIGFKAEGDQLLLIGSEDGGHLGQSLWLQGALDRRDGLPPKVDLAREMKASRLVRYLIHRGRATAVHDVSDGGLLVTIAEMALAGNVGAEIFHDQLPNELTAWLFGESQGRYVVAIPSDADLSKLRDELKELDADFESIGRTGGNSLSLDNIGVAKMATFTIPVADLRAAHEGFFPRLMGSELTPEL
jgi:phosphoribosylformylglycinamidine synthase subunit PurL